MPVTPVQNRHIIASLSRRITSALENFLEGGDELTWDDVNKILRVGSDSIESTVRITGRGYVDAVDATFADPLELDCSASNNHNCTLTASTTINLTEMVAGQSGVISLLNDNVGGYTLTMGAAFTKELSGSTSYDDTADKYNLISWYYDGTNVFYAILNEA